MQSLKNKLVLITGASSGIGAAAATHFAAAGANIILIGRRLEKLQTLASTLEKKYQIKTRCLAFDVRDRAAIQENLGHLNDQWHTPDILINNAGLAIGRETLQEGAPEDWDVMIDTNIKGLLYITHAILPRMLAVNHGHIINLGSIAGHEVYPQGAVYCATKSAVNALTRGLRLDVSGSAIRVTTVDPGAVHTEFSNVRFKGDTARADAVYAGMTPLTADDIAETLLWCATRPAHVNISEIIIMPTDQASATVIHRK